MKKQLKVQITEMFMINVDSKRHFDGYIKRERDNNDNLFVFSKIKMPEGYICSKAFEQEELEKNLIEITKMVLDTNLHQFNGPYDFIFGKESFLN
jgi:hypothetical protein